MIPSLAPVTRSFWVVCTSVMLVTQSWCWISTCNKTHLLLMKIVIIPKCHVKVFRKKNIIFILEHYSTESGRFSMKPYWIILVIWRDRYLCLSSTVQVGTLYSHLYWKHPIPKDHFDLTYCAVGKRDTWKIRTDLQLSVLCLPVEPARLLQHLGPVHQLGSPKIVRQ